MSKVQKSVKNQLFSIAEGMTSTGKICLVLMLTTHRLTKEAFASLRESVSIAGGFSFMQKGKPAYMKIDKETLHSLLINLPKDAWVKPEAKPTKVKATKVKEVLQADTDKQLAAMAKQITALTKLVKKQQAEFNDGPDSDLPF